MTDLDALDRAFLKGSGVSSFPNKGKSAVVDPIDAAFMRGLGQTPTAEVANTSARVPFTPTPVSPRAMAGAIIRGAGEGLAQGARDIGVTAGKSIIGVGETAVGLVDIASAPAQAIFSKLSTGRVQLGQVGKMLEDIGVDFKTTQDILSTLYSDEQKRALQNVSEKKSAKETLVALGANPTVPIHSVLQSIPSMMLAASGSKKLVRRGMSEWLAGALGEGWVQAGSAQEQYRQQSDTGYTTPKQTSLAVASGLVTAAISAASGKASKGMGLEDVESIGASGSSRGSNLEFWRKLVGGMFMEGPVEEGFQSSTEKIAENLALGRPWDEGVVGAYTEGSVSGAIIGAAANALPSKGKSKTSPTLDADAWIKANADMLPTIAAKEKLSRNDWQKLGLPRVPEAERAAFLQKVKDTVGGVAPVVEDAPAVQEQDTPEPEAAVTEEAKPAKDAVPEAKAAVDEVQAELDAQTAEEDADEAAYALFGKREAKMPVPEATATPVEPVAEKAKSSVKSAKSEERAQYGGLTKKQHDQMMSSADAHNKRFKELMDDIRAGREVSDEDRQNFRLPKNAEQANQWPWRDDVPKQPTTREVKTGLKGQTKTVPVEIPTNGEPTTTIVGRMDMVEFERMEYEPNEVTRQNWIDLQRAERRRLGQREEGDNPNAPWAEYEELHRDSVKRALAKGDVVDERILADYPELQTREVKTGRKGVTKKAGGESVLPSAANAEQAETIEGRFIKQLPSGRWVVQSEENRQRAERGEREIGGDRLFASREEAVKETKLEIEIDRRNAAFKATEAAAQAEREAAAAKREAPLNAYLDTITTTPLQRGKLKTTLSKQVARRVSSTGKVYSGSRFEVVNQMVGDGFKADAVEVDAIKDVSRVQWNRMYERQQQEWDARRKAAGKKTEYRLVNTERGNFYDISKAEYDYAKSLEADAAPVLDSKGRTPEQLARMTANARALKEASAKEGALPKVATPKNLAESDLKKLTFDDLINYRSETTEGVAKNRGKTYRKATIDAYDADGVEHTYEVKASSSEPGVTLKKDKKTQGQIAREDASTWNGYNEAIRNEVNRLWPEMNQYQKNVMASLYTGGKAKEFNDSTVQAVIGGRGREAFNANFPGLDSVDAIRKAMSDKGKELVSSSSMKKQSKPNFARENVKKGHYIKRKQPGLGDRKVPWELVSVVSAEGVMVDNKTFVVPFAQITDIRTGMPELGRGEVIFKDGMPVGGKVSAQTASEKDEETTSSEATKSNVSPKSPNAPITDFGEKIGGARKDVWSKSLDDMRQVDDADVAAQPLSKVWPAPDYQKMLEEEGADKSTVALVRALRDSIPTKPRAGWKLRKWAEAVTAARGVAVGLLDGSIDTARARHAIQVVNASKLGEGILDQAELYELVGHEKSLAGIRIASAQYSLLNGVEYNPSKELWSVEQQAKATAFNNWPRQLSIGETRQEAIEKFVAKYNEMDINKPASKQVDFSIYSYRSGKEGFYVGKKVGRNYIDLAGPFDTAKEARKYKSENQEALVEKLAKAKEIPSERRDTNNPRVGEDMRGGQDVTPEMFRDAFGFRGVEFGNWVEQKKRQSDLNDAYDALMDMAAILEINPKAISLNGELALAFGARGSGGRSAGGKTPAAHYEPGKVVINLTKKRGAGSLGHEWWHALDNYFAKMRKGDGYLTEALDVSLVERGSVYEHKGEVRKEMVDAFGGVMKAIRSTAMKARASKLDNRRSAAYWTTKLEMSARAFESYLISKLHDQGASNDYLANIVDDQTWDAASALGFELEGSYPYPTAGEIPSIRAAFDHLFQTIEQKETDKGVALFSTTAIPPSARADIPGELSQAFLASSVAKAKAEGYDIELVDTVSDLPSDIRAQLPSDTSNIEGFYVNGKAYIIGENVTPDRAEAAVREEIAHHKLDTAKGEELIDGFKKRMTEKDRKALIKEGYTKTQGESDADYEARLANEFIAKQARKNTSAWTEFVDRVKSFLERVGVRDLTSEEAARVILRKLRGGATYGEGVRYSLTPAAELDEAKYESAKGIFGPKLERVGEAEFRKWVSEKLPDSAMPYAERFLSERSAMATVPKKKFVTGISRKVVDAELESMGQTPSEGGGQPSWPQLMAQAKADIKANSSAGDSLIANLIENPHPLTQEEIALLNLTKVQRWNEQVAAYESKDKKRLDAAVKRMDEVYFVSALGPDKSKSMQGAALNALKMMTNEKYELVNLVQEYYQATGDVASPGSQAYKDLEAIAQQYKERTEVLERENARLQEEATTMNQSLADALAQAAYNQGKPKSKGKSKAAKIASVADVISKKSRDYGISLIEQARKEQAALNMRASAGVDPARLLMLSKFAAGHIMLGVSDVAAKVSEFYGSKVTAAEMAQIMSEANKIVLDARNRFAKEAESETLASRVIPKGKGAKTATQLSEVSLKDMFREQAENGVKTFKEALPLVGRLVRDSGINATDLQIQDAYSSYINEPGVLSTDTIKKVLAAYRQEAQLLSKINDAKKGVRPHKIGVPRFPSSQEARALEKELDDLMKNVTFSGDKKPTDIASPLDAKKTWMQNEIDDMEKAIALHEERFQGEKGITDQGDIEYQRLKAQLEDVRKRYAEAFPKKPLTQEEQLAILIKQEEKNVDRWNKRVADAKSGKFKSYERVQRPYSERLAELQHQRDNAKAEVARLYELQNPGKRAREAQMKRDLAAIKEMNRRMAAGDYTTRQTKEIDISGDPDAMAAHVAREQTKKTYEQYKARAAWNKMSKARRIAELAKNVLMSDKAIVYSGDNSFVGRQGWFFAMTHMVEWAKSTGKGLTALDTAKSATMVQEIKESDLYKSGVYKAAGININVKDATGNFSTTDDVNLDVADKIPVLGKVAKVSGRLFGASANLMRTNFLRVVLEGSETGRKILANPYELTEKQKDFLKHVGWGVNVFTGFSNNETIKAGALLGAPNWCLSVLENLTQAPVLNALLNGDFDAAAQLEKQYGRFYLATAALMAALSMLPSGPKDDEGKRKRNKVILDPRSNRFGVGYIPYTSIAFNTFGPLAPWVRFLGRNISGQKVSGGRVTNLRNTWLFFATDEEKAQAVPYKEGQMMDNLNFLRSKFRPLVSAAIGLQTGTDYYGNDVPRSRVLVESVSPLVPLHLIDNLVRVSPEQAAFESFMEAFGVDSKPDFNTPQYKKYEAKMKVVDEMFKLKFKDENGKSFGDRAEDFYIANAMKTLHGATDTDSSPGSQESAKMIIDDLGLDACLMLLEYQALDERRRRGGGKISTEPLSETTSSGELSAYGKRVQKLRIISAQ